MNIKLKRIPLKDSSKLKRLMKKLSEDTIYYGLTLSETNVMTLDIFINLINERLSHKIVFGIYDGNKLIGRVGVSKNSPKRKNHVCTLFLGIIKEYWGNGIGGKSLDFIINKAKKSGYTVMRLCCYSENIRAINLYKSRGFIEVGKLPKTYKCNKTYYEATIMQLDLEG